MTDEDGEPCPELQERFGGDVRHATGGCTFEWFGAKHQPVTVSTLFGDFVLSDCNLGISLRVDSQGRTWTTDTNLGASTGGTSACGDVYRCTSDPGAEERTPGLEWPWRGRMSSDGNGGLVHHIALCWETCVGFFTGDLELRIRRDGKSWRAELQDDLDTSGFTLDQSLKVFKGGFDVRDA